MQMTRGALWQVVRGRILTKYRLGILHARSKPLEVLHSLRESSMSLTNTYLYCARLPVWSGRSQGLNDINDTGNYLRKIVNTLKLHEKKQYNDEHVSDVLLATAANVARGDGLSDMMAALPAPSYPSQAPSFTFACIIKKD
eukprot:2562652-Pleurochrysis_carterae.AAC.2